MTSIYLIRHAQAQGNLLGRFQGRTDNPLTDKGVEQSHLLAVRFQAVPLRAVYTSPLERARRTAEAVAHPKGLVPHSVDDLVEIDGGDMENLTFEDLRATYPDEFEMFNSAPHLFEGVGAGESIRAVHARMVAAIDRIARENFQKTVAVVSHGCAIRCYLCHAAGWPIERMNEVGWNPNTGVSHVVFDRNMQPHLMRVGDDTHLGRESVYAQLQEAKA